MAPKTVVFASGKGGVGKSTVALNVAVTLAGRGLAVGLIDADVYGPDIPAMLGITRRAEARSLTLWSVNEPKTPPVESHGIKVMSPQFLIGEDQSMDWQAPTVQMLLRRFIEQTDWGELDLLLIDVPPGTGDLQQALFSMIDQGHAVLVVTPQYVSHLDGRKLLSMLRRRRVKVIGAVENMVGLECPHCGGDIELYAPTGTNRTVWSADVPHLASLPFLPYDSAEPSTPLVMSHPDTPVARGLIDAADRIRAAVLP